MRTLACQRSTNTHNHKYQKLVMLSDVDRLDEIKRLISAGAEPIRATLYSRYVGWRAEHIAFLLRLLRERDAELAMLQHQRGRYADNLT